jgi:hypothetical protein
MALENSQHGQIYLSVFSGKLTRRVPADTEGSVSRENKNGKVVHELTYDKLSGILTGIEFREGDYGREIHFCIEDCPDTYRLQLPFSSKVAKSIIMRLPNCDLSAPLDIHTGWDKEKESTFAWIVQNGSKVLSAYTKENPGGLPPMEQIKVKGKDTWDDSKQLEFLDAMLKKDILPLFGKKTEPRDTKEPEPESDLPW